VDPVVTQALAELQVRQKCNRVTGCPPLTVLLQRVPAAIGPVIALLRERGRADAYWIEVLLSFLGQTDRPEALPALAPFVRDRRWTPRLEAVLAVGRLHRHTRPETRDLLEAALKMAESSGDVAWQAALHHALARLEPSAARAHEAALLALYPVDPVQIQAISPPILDWLVRVAGEARLTRAAPLLRGACLSDNRFVGVTALQTVAALQDTGAIPFALSRLDDRQPAIRRAALLALQTITGSRPVTEAEAWRKWAADKGLAELPEAWRGGWTSAAPVLPGFAEEGPPPGLVAPAPSTPRGP
jgi:HEAT repeat protein